MRRAKILHPGILQIQKYTTKMQIIKKKKKENTVNTAN